MLSEQSKAEILKTREEYPDAQSALLPALHRAQKDYGGWLPEQAFDEVASLIGLPATLVASAASFYSMYNRKPVGRHPADLTATLPAPTAPLRRLPGSLPRPCAVRCARWSRH